MKKFIAVMSVLIFVTLLSVGCGDNSVVPNSRNITTDPFFNGSNQRNLIVVISDLHLGADLNYAECRDNLPALERFIKQVKESPNVKELVIAGDLVDEWFVPANVDTYLGKGQNDFVQRVMLANKGIFDALNSVIKEGKIRVVYIPGNHDLTISAENIDSILSGVHQVRDANVELGLGTYVPADYPMIAIEHGHRYNFFCAPDPISNQDVAKGTIMPPGYFFTRIAAL
jgi:DNA polymerase II small subunit/DNA polymerase delta subunit B